MPIRVTAALSSSALPPRRSPVVLARLGRFHAWALCGLLAVPACDEDEDDAAGESDGSCTSLEDSRPGTRMPGRSGAFALDFESIESGVRTQEGRTSRTLAFSIVDAAGLEVPQVMLVSHRVVQLAGARRGRVIALDENNVDSSTPGRFVVRGLILDDTGLWQLEVDISDGARMDSIAGPQFCVTVADDPATTTTGGEETGVHESTSGSQGTDAEATGSSSDSGTAADGSATSAGTGSTTEG